MAITEHFFRDAYAAAPRTERGRLEAEVANLRRQLWSSPEDKRELLGMIEALEAQMRALDAREGRP